MLQNLPYFCHENPCRFFHFSFHATLFFPLMNALVYVDILVLLIRFKIFINNLLKLAGYPFSRWDKWGYKCSKERGINAILQSKMLSSIGSRLPEKQCHRQIHDISIQNILFIPSGQVDLKAATILNETICRSQFLEIKYLQITRWPFLDAREQFFSRDIFWSWKMANTIDLYFFATDNVFCSTCCTIG